MPDARDELALRAARGLVVAASVGLGALFAVGLFLSALFEAQGFGGDREGDPGAGHYLLLALGIVACVAVPAALWRRLLPGSAPAAPFAFAVALVGVAIVLGIGLGA